MSFVSYSKIVTFLSFLDSFTPSGASGISFCIFVLFPIVNLIFPMTETLAICIRFYLFFFIRTGFVLGSLSEVLPDI